MHDLTPTTDRLAALLDGVRDDQLDGPTPMGDRTVAELLQHLLGLSVAFRDAAGKVDGPTTGTPPGPVTEPLPDGWRDLLRSRLGELAGAWSDPAAWEGDTTAGGVTLPAGEMGVVALDEVLLHGWDLAAATGQDYAPTDEECRAVLPMVTPHPDPEVAAQQRVGLFGPPVEVPDDAPLFHRVLGLAGRDPGWTP